MPPGPVVPLLPRVRIPVPDTVVLPAEVLLMPRIDALTSIVIVSAPLTLMVSVGRVGWLLPCQLPGADQLPVAAVQV